MGMAKFRPLPCSLMYMRYHHCHKCQIWNLLPTALPVALYISYVFTLEPMTGHHLLLAIAFSLDFVTPLVKSLLVERRKLRSQGKMGEADKLAEKINSLIPEYHKKWAHLEHCCPRELWSSVRGTLEILELITHTIWVTSFSFVYLLMLTLPTCILSAITKFSVCYEQCKILHQVLMVYRAGCLRGAHMN